jgi:hypothetical protein
MKEKSMKLELLGIALFGLCLAHYGFADIATSATTTSPQKVGYKTAKAECLKQDANMTGKALKKCIHEKRQVASAK